MGIGVSYTGVGGSRTNFTAQGGNAAVAELQRLQSETSMLKQMAARRSGGGGGGSAPKITNEQRRQAKERDREAKYERLRERGINREGKKKANPFEQWADRLKRNKDGEIELDKIDPRKSGPDITGAVKSRPEPSTLQRNATGKDAFVESYISDLFVQTSGDNKSAYIYKFRRRRKNTGQGRVFAVSGEECEQLGKIPLLNSDTIVGGNRIKVTENDDGTIEIDYDENADGSDGSHSDGCNGWCMGSGPGGGDTPDDLYTNGIWAGDSVESGEGGNEWAEDDCFELNGKNFT